MKAIAFLIIFFVFFFSCDVNEERHVLDNVAVEDTVSIRYHQLIYLSCLINDTVPANLAFDSGAYGLILDSLFYSKKLEKSFKLPIVDTETRFTNVSVRRDSSIKVPTVSFAGHRWTASRVLKANFKSMFGKHIDGIVGWDFFRNYVVEISYDKSYVRLLTAQSFKKETSWAAIPLIKKGKLFFIKAQLQISGSAAVNGEFMFDTGNAGGLVVSNDFAKSHSFDTIKGKYYSSSKNAHVKGGVTKYTTKIRNIKLEKFNLSNQGMSYIADSISVFTNVPFSGLLGNQNFERFNMYIDFSNQVLYLTPNSFFGRDYFFSNSGLTVADRTDIVDGWVINSLWENSDAYKLNIRTGDIITHIDGRSVKDFPLFSEDSVLNQPNRSIRLTLRRNSNVYSVILPYKKYL